MKFAQKTETIIRVWRRTGASACDADEERRRTKPVLLSAGRGTFFLAYIMKRQYQWEGTSTEEEEEARCSLHCIAGVHLATTRNRISHRQVDGALLKHYDHDDDQSVLNNTHLQIATDQLVEEKRTGTAAVTVRPLSRNNRCKLNFN